MTRNLATLASSVNDAQRRVRDSTRQTAEWRDAQHAAVQARLDYWSAMCLDWDVRHPRPAATDELPVSTELAPKSGVEPAADARWFPAPHLRRAGAV